MDILIIGGTRYIGTHLVRELLKQQNNITIATRGKTPDSFGDTVQRLILDRADPESVRATLSGKRFDVVYDNVAYSSNGVKYLLDTVECGRYIQISTMSVYHELKINLAETDFDPLLHPLKWCAREDFPYDEVKRQAECAVFQCYSHIPAAAVRFPFVIGEDDYTKRLYFYVENIVKSRPMLVNNLDEKLAFVNSAEAGGFLAWLAQSSFTGPVNAASYGNIRVADIIKYTEERAGKKAIFADHGEAAPYNHAPTYSLDLRTAERTGYSFSKLTEWIYNLLDAYIRLAEHETPVNTNDL